MVEIRVIAHGSKDYDQAVALRRAVLRTPLGLDFAPEDLAREVADTHLAAFSGEYMIGAVVMTPYGPGKVKLRQMAVADEARGQSVGAKLLAAFEHHARSNGVTEIVLAARDTAKGFYARQGYSTDDAVFTEVTIPHIRMWKML